MSGARAVCMLSAEWEAKERVICDVANPIEARLRLYKHDDHGLTELTDVNPLADASHFALLPSSRFEACRTLANKYTYLDGQETIR